MAKKSSFFKAPTKVTWDRDDRRKMEKEYMKKYPGMTIKNALDSEKRIVQEYINKLNKNLADARLHRGYFELMEKWYTENPRAEYAYNDKAAKGTDSDQEGAGEDG
ncbi:MAG: hypothetical protein L6Q59_17290, partial [Ignavibacteriaceae bacterium]|nr:hypothetical protein [Ignavibacteriaceae bacterium]